MRQTRELEISSAPPSWVQGGGGRTAADFLEAAPRGELVRAVRDYGEEPRWRAVVDAIVRARGGGALARTASAAALVADAAGRRGRVSFSEGGRGGATHTAPSKYHDEIISLECIHTKYGKPIVIMVFRCTIQKVLGLSPPSFSVEQRRFRIGARSPRVGSA
jgi:hypothetical protein